MQVIHVIGKIIQLKTEILSIHTRKLVISKPYG
jgi:hypothetical protein